MTVKEQFLGAYELVRIFMGHSTCLMNILEYFICPQNGFLVPYIYANCFEDFTLLEFCFILKKFARGS